MNKKVIAMAVTAALAAPMIAQAADINFKADARYRYGSVNTANKTNTTAADNRVRLFVDAKNDAGISAHVRLQEDTDKNAGAGAVDEAYLEMPVMGGMATLKAGDQLANFGTGFGINKDTPAPQRVSLAVPVSGWNIVLMDDHGSGDNVLVAGKAGGWKIALLSVAKQTSSKAGMFIFANGNLGPVNLTIEQDSKPNNGTAPTGTLLMGMMPIGGMNLHFGYASTTNGFTAGTKFNPTSTIGTDQKTGLLDFGSTGDTTAELVGIDMMAGPGKLVATLGTGSYKAGAISPSLSILDLQYHIPMNKTSDFAVTYGSVSSDNVMAADGSKSISAYGFTINTKF